MCGAHTCICVHSCAHVRSLASSRQVSLDAYGEATIDEDVPRILYMLGALVLTSERGPLTGGGELTLRGSGFGTAQGRPDDCVRVTVGGRPCELQLCAFTVVRCRVPATPQSDTGVSEQIEIVEVAGMDMTAVTAGEYTYSRAITPVVSAITPQWLSSAVSSTVTLSGTLARHRVTRSPAALPAV